MTALAQGAVAAAPFNDPALTITPDKYKVLFYGHQYYPKFTWQVAVTTKEFAGKNSQALRKILDVHRKAVEFVYGNREETARIYAKVWEVSLAEANAILPKYYEWQHWSRGDFSKEGLAAVTDGLISVGELKEPFDWNRLIDQSRSMKTCAARCDGESRAHIQDRGTEAGLRAADLMLTWRCAASRTPIPPVPAGRCRLWSLLRDESKKALGVA